MVRMLDQKILTRLVYSKYLLYSGNEVLEKELPLADGLALLNYQDATEMFLRALAGYLDASMKEQSGFDEIIKRIEDAPNNTLRTRIPLKSSLHELNKARVNFKHFGILPIHEDILKIKNDINAFFQQALYSFFDLDLEKVSLKELINHIRIKNCIGSAENYFEEEKYLECIIECRKVFCILMKRIKPDAVANLKDGKFEPKLNKTLEAFCEIINDHSLLFELFRCKVDLNEYNKFVEITPNVALSMANSFHIDLKPNCDKNATRTNASFCINFITNFALKVLKYTDSPLINAKRSFKVIKQTNIMIYPMGKSEIEIVRVANENEILQGHYEYNDSNHYFAIVQDDSLAFVHKDDVIKVSI
jgi:hypothetical protein